GPGRRVRRPPVAGAAGPDRTHLRLPGLLGGRHGDLRAGQPGAGPAGRRDAAPDAVDRVLQGRGPGTAAVGRVTFVRSPARSTPASPATPHDRTVTTANDTIRLVAWATIPIALGATRPEVEGMVATPAIARLGFVPLRPAAAKRSGTTTAMPRPVRAKPATAGGGGAGRTSSRRPGTAT